MKSKQLEIGMRATAIAALGLILLLAGLRPVMAAGAIANLPVFALPLLAIVGLACWFVGRALHGLAHVNRQVDELARAHGMSMSETPAGVALFGFIARFDAFMQRLGSKMKELDNHALQAGAESHLLSYKREKAEAVLESMADAILVVDHACVPGFANTKVETLLGVRREDLIGRPLQTWCADQEVRSLLMRFTQDTESAAHTASLEYSPAERPDRKISVAVHPLFSPRDQSASLGNLIVFRDVTQEHAARQAGAEFVGHVSHELKTPLAALAGYSELLMDFQNLTDTDRINAVNVIRDEVERIAALINNLLNISRLETGSLAVERQRVKMHELLQDAVETAGRAAAAKGVALELNAPADIGSARLDKDLFRIAVANLLSNAVKYSDRGGRVLVTAEALEDQRMRITVQDRGIGIAAEECRKVFDKYYRSGSEGAAARGGHGLGLYLARRIVELHHGVVSVASELGAGSTFTIEFEAQNPRLDEAAAL